MQTWILAIVFERLWSDHFGQIFACCNLFSFDKILPCFLARLYLDQILPGTLEELGVHLGKIPANQNLARQSWLFIQGTCKILGNIFSGDTHTYGSEFLDLLAQFIVIL